MVEGVTGGKHCIAIFQECQTNEVVAGDSEAAFAVRCDANDAAVTAKTSRNIKISLYVEGHALGPPETLIEDGGVAIAIDGVDGLILDVVGPVTKRVPASLKARW